MADLNDDYNPQKAIEKLAANLEQPNKFATIFCEAAKTQKTMDDVLKSIMKNLIQHDKDARSFIKDILKEFEKENLWASLKNFGFAIWSLLTLTIGGITGALITHLLR
jgi:hypothetical protein